MSMEKDIQLTVVNEMKDRKSNYVTSNIIESANFWNREGMKAIENNISGKWGTKEQNEMARTMDGDDFLLQLMLTDCNTFCNSETAKNLGIKFECGRTRSHVWVHMDDERVLMIHA